MSEERIGYAEWAVQQQGAWREWDRKAAREERIFKVVVGSVFGLAFLILVGIILSSLGVFGETDLHQCQRLIQKGMVTEARPAPCLEAKTL